MFNAYHTEFLFSTKGKGTYEITNKVADVIRVSQVQTGLVNVFLRHTSASLLLFENADSTARRDLENFFERLVLTLWKVWTTCPVIFVWRSRGPRNRSRSPVATCG
jgi:secondary thiamine-phosphate synthase enzyme